MKKLVSVLCVLSLSVAMLAGCGSSSETTTTTTTDSNTTTTETAIPETSFSAVLLVAGTLGDKSFFDSANAGMEMAESQLGVEIKVIEMGTDVTKYEPTFRDICAGDWDLIISGSPDMTEILNQYAMDYPDQQFMNYDASDETVTENVYSVAYGANDLSYLAGVLAGLATISDDIENVNDASVIGFIGGMDIPGINDFLVGYIEGAKDVNPDIQVIISYAQSYVDPAKGKELALNQYNAGADVIFSAAGGTGLGVLDAAKETGLYAIGVDSDQALTYIDTDPDTANQILSSAIKQIDQVVYNAIEAAMNGTLAVGTYEILGVAQEGVGMAKNDIYLSLVPSDIQTAIEDAEAGLVSGDISVVTAVGMSADDLDALRNSVS